MSDEDEKPDTTNNLPVPEPEQEQFMRQFAKFMRNSLAMTQTEPEPKTTPKSPKKAQPEPPRFTLDTSPLLVTFKLNGDNYPLWSILMNAALSGRGVMSHITGVPPPPPRTDPLFEQWQRIDHQVFTWLMHNLEQKLINRFSKHPTAKHVWDSLAVTYASGGDAIQAFDLHRQASALKQNDDTLEDTWNLLQDIWVSIDQQEPNPMKYPEDIEIDNQKIQVQRLYQFLIAISDKYESAKKEILKILPLPSVESAYAIIRRGDTQSHSLRSAATEEKNSVPGIGAGLVARDRGRPPWQSGGRGTSGRGGSSNRRMEEDRTKLLCSHCGWGKHTKEQCFELVGIPD